MIKLEILPQCHHCLEFEADVENAQIFHFSNRPFGISDTIIRCKYRESCKGVKGYNRMLSKIAPEDALKGLDLLEHLISNCDDVDEQEQEEIEELDIDFDNLDGDEIDLQ